MNAKYGNITTKILTVLLVLAMIFVAGESAQFVSTLEEHTKKALQKDGDEITIVVDAGHGSGNLRKVTKGKKIQKERQPLSLILQLNKSQKIRRSNMSVYFFTQISDERGLIPWQYSGWKKARITRLCLTTTYATPTCP